MMCSRHLCRKREGFGWPHCESPSHSAPGNKVPVPNNLLIEGTRHRSCLSLSNGFSSLPACGVIQIIHHIHPSSLWGLGASHPLETTSMPFTAPDCSLSALQGEWCLPPPGCEYMCLVSFSSSVPHWVLCVQPFPELQVRNPSLTNEVNRRQLKYYLIRLGVGFQLVTCTEWHAGGVCCTEHGF